MAEEKWHDDGTVKCNMTLNYRKSSDELRDRLSFVIIRNCIQRGRLRWFGHVEGVDKDSWVKKLREIVVEGLGGWGW